MYKLTGMQLIFHWILSSFYLINLTSRQHCYNFVWNSPLLNINNLNCQDHLINCQRQLGGIYFWQMKQNRISSLILNNRADSYQIFIHIIILQQTKCHNGQINRLLWDLNWNLMIIMTRWTVTDLPRCVVDCQFSSDKQLNQKLFVCFPRMRQRGVEFKEGKEESRLVKEKMGNHCTRVCSRHYSNMLMHTKPYNATEQALLKIDERFFFPLPSQSLHYSRRRVYIWFSLSSTNFQHFPLLFMVP